MITDWTGHGSKLVTWLDEEVLRSVLSTAGSDQQAMQQLLARFRQLIHYSPALISELGAGSYYCSGFVPVPDRIRGQLPEPLRQACRSAVFRVKVLDTERDPLVTVITCTYNREESCVRAVNSVLSQTYGNIRCLVVKDGEGSYASLPDDPRVEFHSLPRRGDYPEDAEKAWHIAGRDPWNYANALTEGPIICQLDDDDIFYPDHVQTIVDEWLKSKAHLIYTESHTSDKQTPFEFDYDPDLLERQNFIFSCAAAYCGPAIMFTYSPLFADMPGDWAGLRRVKDAGLVFRKINRITSEHAPEAPTRKRRETVEKLWKEYHKGGK